MEMPIPDPGSTDKTLYCEKRRRQIKSSFLSWLSIRRFLTQQTTCERSPLCSLLPLQQRWDIQTAQTQELTSTMNVSLHFGHVDLVKQTLKSLHLTVPVPVPVPVQACRRKLPLDCCGNRRCNTALPPPSIFTVPPPWNIPVPQTLVCEGSVLRAQGGHKQNQTLCIPSGCRWCRWVWWLCSSWRIRTWSWSSRSTDDWGDRGDSVNPPSHSAKSFS